MKSDEAKYLALHTQSKVRDPETGELVNSPADFKSAQTPPAKPKEPASQPKREGE